MKVRNLPCPFLRGQPLNIGNPTGTTMTNLGLQIVNECQCLLLIKLIFREIIVLHVTL